ncbi:MAG: hypothetical protein ACYCYR_00325 [Desulfobulbaceae bacterium]
MLYTVYQKKGAQAKWQIMFHPPCGSSTFGCTSSIERFPESLADNASRELTKNGQRQDGFFKKAEVVHFQPETGSKALP